MYPLYQTQLQALELDWQEQKKLRKPAKPDEVIEYEKKLGAALLMAGRHEQLSDKRQLKGTALHKRIQKRKEEVYLMNSKNVFEKYNIENKLYNNFYNLMYHNDTSLLFGRDVNDENKYILISDNYNLDFYMEDNKIFCMFPESIQKDEIKFNNNKYNIGNYGILD